MRILLYAVIALVLVVGVVLAIGAMLPVKHVATRERLFAAPPDRLYSAISRVSDYPKWKTGVRAVEEVPAEGGRARFREVGAEKVTYEITEAKSPERFVTRIADKNLPYGGIWTYELSPANEGTKLRLTENGEVYNLFFRFMSKFVFGHYKTMDSTLDDLQRYVAGS
ncbi:MAG TPA: SRPBCC domain-containing protein [Gemmatimonadaceae bacterium]|nr:SRPBCC domain-containing protein [Gemmatimonadaceae bacterium]